MNFNITKDWIMNNAKLEDGQSVDAGLPPSLPLDMTHIPGVNVVSGLEENFFLYHEELGYPPFASSRETILEYIKAEFDNMEDGDEMNIVIRRKDMTRAQIEALPET